jgi:hypothetical protein
MPPCNKRLSYLLPPPYQTKVTQQMISSGGLHGNLNAFSPYAMRSMRERGFQLPIGIYPTDSVLGAALAYGMASDCYHWDLSGRILTVPTASWSLDISSA